MVWTMSKIMKTGYLVFTMIISRYGTTSLTCRDWSPRTYVKMLANLKDEGKKSAFLLSLNMWYPLILLQNQIARYLTLLALMLPI